MAYGMNIKDILYGGDYNPEQWPQEMWEEDIRLMKKAHINIVTLNTFSWAALQPSEDSYCFEKLDKIMDFVRKNGLKGMHGHFDRRTPGMDGKKASGHSAY